MTLSLDQISELLERAEKDAHGLPPVDKWNPPLSGTIDMQILADGRWLHEGDEIKRHELVKLFSTILKREGDDYFLVTPVEKWKLQVEDAPFVATQVEQVEDNGVIKLVFTTNVDSHVVAGAEHPLWVETDPVTAAPRPYVRVRANLDALIGRNAFYQLVAMAQENAAGQLQVTSDGECFSLGSSQ